MSLTQTAIELSGRAFGVSPEDIKTRSRKSRICTARQAAMYLVRCAGSGAEAYSFPSIGRYFGGRDHTTVMHALEKMERLAAESPEFRAKLQKLRDEFFAVLEKKKRIHREPLPRITTSEVCLLAGYGPQKLRAEINAKRMPPPVDRGKEMIFSRQEVLTALGIAQPENKEAASW